VVTTTEGVSVSDSATGGDVIIGDKVGATVIGVREVGKRVGWLPNGGGVGRFVGGRKVGPLVKEALGRPIVEFEARRVEIGVVIALPPSTCLAIRIRYKVDIPFISISF
jgi:hypothetical protein